MTSAIESNNMITNNYINTPPTNGTAASAVVCIISEIDDDGDGIKDDEATGTGYLVGPNIVVTAAHCVVSYGDTTILSSKIYYDQHSYNLNNTYVLPDRLYYSYAFTSEAQDVSDRYDYCIIELESDITRSFYFNCIPSSNVSTNTTVRITGYPEDFYISSSDGTITEFWDNMDYNFAYTNSSNKGFSGSPVYKTNYTCVGVHGGSFNYDGETTRYGYGILFHSQFYSTLTQRLSANS